MDGNMPLQYQPVAIQVAIDYIKNKDPNLFYRIWDENNATVADIFFKYKIHDKIYNFDLKLIYSYTLSKDIDLILRVEHDKDKVIQKTINKDQQIMVKQAIESAIRQKEAQILKVDEKNREYKEVDDIASWIDDLLMEDNMMFYKIHKENVENKTKIELIKYGYESNYTVIVEPNIIKLQEQNNHGTKKCKNLLVNRFNFLMEYEKLEIFIKTFINQIKYVINHQRHI